MSPEGLAALAALEKRVTYTRTWETPDSEQVLSYLDDLIALLLTEAA